MKSGLLRYSPYRLFGIQLELECKGFDANGDLIRIPGSNPDEINRFHVLKLPDRYIRIFRHDVPLDVRCSLSRFSDEEAFAEQSRIRQVLTEAMGPADTWVGRTYIFTDVPSSSEFPRVVRTGDCWTVVVDGQEVSWAQSARQNEKAAELGVETLEEYRRRGFGRQVAAAWASSMLKEGRIAFYSHTLDNIASEQLALSLGVEVQFEFAGY